MNAVAIIAVISVTFKKMVLIAMAACQAFMSVEWNKLISDR